MLMRIVTDARKALQRRIREGMVPRADFGAPRHRQSNAAPPNHRSARRPQPRRARAGLSLFEAALVMMIAVPMTQQGVRLGAHYIREQAGMQESRLLTQVVSAASAYALRDLNARITNRVDLGPIQVLTLGDLADQNAWLSTASRTALGRDIEVIFHARGPKELAVLARAVTPAGEDTRPYVPRGGEGIGLVGYVPEHAPNMLLGPGLNYDLSTLQAQATAQDGISPPVVGDQLAITVLRLEQDVSPYLRRDGQNRMQADLDMGGFDLVGAGEIIADKVISDTIITEQAVVEDLIAAEVTITGSCTGCAMPPVTISPAPDTEGQDTP